MNESNKLSSQALDNFKTQLDHLSQSLQEFDANERDKALEILQECIEGLEKNQELVDISPGIQQTSTGITESLHSNVMKAEFCDKVNTGIQEVNISNELNVEGPNYSDLTTIGDLHLTCPKCQEKHSSQETFLEHLQAHSGKTKRCLECLKEFPNAECHKFHKELGLCRPARNGKTLKCKFCGEKFSKRSSYQNHIKAHKQNRCKICDQSFSRRKHLIAHASNAHKVNLLEKTIFRCDLCEKTFTQRRSLVHHHQLSHKEAGVVCSVCLQRFDNNDQLEFHSAEHRQLMSTFTCHHCQQQFSRRQQYLTHLKSHDKYQCSECEAGFASQKSAVAHNEATKHLVNGLEAQLMCAQCGQLFLTAAQLNLHTLQHTGENITYCEKCKIGFKSVKNYKLHLQTNSHLQGEESKKLLACDQCSKTFANKTNLRVHISRVHKTKPSLSCTHCNYTTSRPENLKRHISIHTEEPQYICDQCGLKLQTKNSLQEHFLRIHSGKKDFSCEKCGKVFPRGSDLNRHLLTHTEEKPFSCQHCGNTYKLLNSLKKHIFLSHGIDPGQPRRKRPSSSTNDETTKATKRQNANTDQNFKPQVSSSIVDSNLVIMGDNHQEELLEVPFNLDFTNDKAQSYNQNLDLQVVESMMQLEESPSKQEQNVLLNVRNLFGRGIDNEFILASAPLEPSMIDNLTETLSSASQHIAISTEKQEDIPVLQDYMISPDLNFLNV